MPTPTPDADPDDQARAQRGSADREPAASPAIPSLASLRDPRRRTAVDLLMPPTAAGPTAAPSDPAGPAPGAPAPAAAARPPEWSDLWLLGRHVARSLLGVPARALCWSVRRPAALVRRSAR